MPKETFFNLPGEKRQLLIDLALDEFAANSYRTASISRIVEQAGIAKGSFYQYFDNKRDLYLYLLELGAAQKAEFLRATPPPEPDMGTFAYLRWLFEAGVRFEFSHPRLTRVAYRAYSTENALPDETLAQAVATSQTFFEQLVRRGIEQGDLRADLDVETAVFLFNTLLMELGGHILRRINADPRAPHEEGVRLFEHPAAARIFNQFMDMLEHGMANPSRHRASQEQAP